MKYTGRPAKYKNPEDMQKIITEYFEECKAEGKYPTVSMMAFRLGMSRKVLLEYEKSIEDDEYLKQLDCEEGIDNIYFLGLVADICVVSNILLVKGFLPEKNIYLYKDLTEGLTDEKKKSAIDVLESCHIKMA